MTDQQREKVVRALSGKIKKEGPVRLSSLYKVLQEVGLDRTLYNGKKPKMWMIENFDEFVVIGSNGYETIQLSEDPVAKAARILDEVITQEGRILLSKIPPLLKEQGIDYKQLAAGKNLKDWLEEAYLNYTFSEDNLWLYRKGGAAPATVSSVQKNEDVQSPEVQQMHQVAFMGWWSVNARRLRDYNEELSSESAVRETIARQLAGVMLGTAKGVIDARAEEEPKVAFDSGLKHANGEVIYCVLIPNPKDDGTKQKWSLPGFACASDQTPMGGWLRAHIRSAAGTGITFSNLEDATTAVSGALRTLLPQLQEYLTTLQEGRLPQQMIAGDMAAFEKQTEDLRQMYREVWHKDYPDDLSLEQVTEQNQGTQGIQHKLLNALEAFDRIADGAEAFFKGWNLPKKSGEDTYTPTGDKAALHRQYENLTADVDLGLFEDTLCAYEVLSEVMTASVYSDQLGEKVENVLCTHFPEISERFAMRGLVGSSEEDGEFLRELDTVRAEIAVCKKQLSQFTGSTESKRNVTPEELLDDCLQSNRDGMILAEYAAAIYPENEEERALVQATAGQDDRQPEELTYYGAAMRLYRVIGNRDGLAEKYLILGLTFDEEHCVPALLELYRKEQRTADFKKIMKLFSDEREIGLADQLFYLDILCREAPQTVWDYVQKYDYLFYLQECMELLLSLPEGALPEEERQLLSDRLRSYQVYQQPNELEQALLAGDLEKVHALAGQRELLLQMGYSTENVQQIAEAAQNEVAVGDGQLKDYGKGLRLYRFQGNIHGMAERYLWKGIAQDRTLIGKQLMALLAKEERWEECRRLYDCFRTLYAGNPVCRQLYLMALLRIDAPFTREYVRKNLQECLTLMGSQSGADVSETVRELAESGTKEQREFYGCLRQLADTLSVPIVKNVVLMEGTLREYATPESAREAGIPAEYIDSIINVYKFDSYPHGEDAVSVAKRADCFFGSYRGVAECAAKLALPDANAVELLWKIYGQLGEEKLQFALMQQYPDLQEAHEDLYADLLFEKEAYEEFLCVCDGSDCSWGRTLQKFIAALKLDLSADVLLPAAVSGDQQEELSWYERWGSLLTETLFVADRISDVETVLCSGFGKWISVLSKDVLKALVTGAGAATEEELLQVQEQALNTGSMELALYIYNVLHIGDLTAESEAFLAFGTQEQQLAVGGELLENLQKLRAIYGDASGEVNAKIALLRIKQIKEQTGLSGGVTGEVAAMLSEFSSDGQFLEELLALLDQTEVGRMPEVCQKLAQLPETKEDRQRLVQFFNSQPLQGAGRDYMGLVCGLDLELLWSGDFPEEALDPAEALCKAYVEAYKSTDGILCLYEIEQARGQSAHADYLLRVLADQPKDTMEEETGQKVVQLITERWDTKLPGYFDLFKGFLEHATIEEIEQYIAFAHVAVRAEWSESNLVQADLDGQENQMLSEKDSNTVIKQLYMGKRDAWNWCTRLPMQDHPAGYAKLLFLARMHWAVRWETCADYCEKYEQNELLLRVLVNWAKSADEAEAQQCRKYLEECLRNRPDYFTTWSGRTELTGISECICDQVKKSEQSRTAEWEIYYASICAAALIAEKTGSAEALDHLLNVFRDSLFGSGCNIGVALAAILLLDERFEEAQKVLGQLKNVLVNMNYRELVNDLAEKSVDELKCWRQDTKNVIMLRMIPMDGNRPSLQKINEIVQQGIEAGQAKETAEAIEVMLELFPNDYGAYNALFNLCCTQFEGFLPMLLKSLHGLVENRPGSAASYYRRDQMQYARMLAALDALLYVTGEKEKAVPEDYEKDQATQMYRWNLKDTSLSYEQIAEAAKEEKRIRESFENHNPYEQELMAEAYISCITGNWRNLIRRVREQDQAVVISDVMNSMLDASVEDIGFARSVLAVLPELQKEERLSLVDRLKDLLGASETKHNKTRRQEQILFVEYILKAGYFDRLEEQIDPKLSQLLESTFEDYSCYMYWMERYVKPAIERDADDLFEISLLVGGLVCQDGFWNELLKCADRLFDQGKDRQAGCLYYAVTQLNHSFQMKYSDRKLRALYSRLRELAEARYRITALFTGDKQIMEKVGSRNFHVWSCVNMVLTMIASKRSDEVLRLASYLDERNKTLATALLRGMDPAVDLQEKWKAMELLTDDVAKIYYCYVIKHPYNPKNHNEKCFALGDGPEAMELADKLNQTFLNLAKEQQKRELQKKDHLAVGKQSLSPAHLLLLVNDTVKAHISALQKDPAQWKLLKVSEETEEIPVQSDLGELPFYARELEPLQGEESVEELKNRRRELQNSIEQIGEKEELSRKLCRYCLGDMNSSDGELRDALLLYGNDHYYHEQAMKREEKNEEEAERHLEEANRTLIALAGILKNASGGQESTAAGEEVKSMIRDTGLYELLFSAHSLKELLASYAEYRSLYHFMRSLLIDPLLMACVGQIYAVLDSLKNCYSDVMPENVTTLRMELSESRVQLEKIETNRWMELKNRTQMLIKDAIYELDQRPVLKVEVLNEGVQSSDGYLYGQVSNVGQVTAEDVVLQATYNHSGRNSTSRQYELKRLMPGACAVFEIDYSASDLLTPLEYYLDVSFSYGDKEYSVCACTGRLQLGEVELPEYEIESPPESGMDFDVNEQTGEIYSHQFIGRGTETATMRRLVNGENFRAYKSLLVYGIKRTGKTSLLDYLAAYIKANRKNVICVRVNCQGLSSKAVIHEVFVESVFKQLTADGNRAKFPKVNDADDAWKKFEKTWRYDYCADFNTGDLDKFYQYLGAYLGEYGLYMIIDEIDQLFEMVSKQETGGENQMCNLDMLFGAIRTILDTAECRAVVHFVLCGSNWLIRYNLRGDKTNQLFQRFGRQVLSVGRLPEKDAKDVVCKPYSEGPKFTEEALTWIWDAAGGLVWHTRLLADYAAERAIEAGRSVIYPSDVYESMPKMLDYRFCKQFSDACDDDGDQVIDALQSLASKKDSYVHVNRISDLLQWDQGRLHKALKLLTALKIIEQHATDPQYYRFELDIYRRYFRRRGNSRYLQEPEDAEIFRRRGKMDVPEMVEDAEIFRRGEKKDVPEMAEDAETIRGEACPEEDRHTSDNTQNTVYEENWDVFAILQEVTKDDSENM